MKYLEAKFTITPNSQDARDILAALASEAGFESFDEYEEGLKAYVQMDLFDKEVLQTAIDTFPIPSININYEINEVEEKNWNEQWEQEGFAPIIIDDKCIIYDARKESPTCDLPMSIGIAAKQAFGTGNHETTQMIVAALLNCDLEGKRVLDCGCGTGILGIVAKKSGASEVVGYDIDDWSVNNAIHNAELNGVEMEILEGDRSVLSHISGVFNVVVANINRNILLDDIPYIAEVMAEKATLILSGFYVDDAPLLVDKAMEYGFKENKKLINDKWCCLVLKRNLIKEL